MSTRPKTFVKMAFLAAAVLALAPAGAVCAADAAAPDANGAHKPGDWVERRYAAPDAAALAKDFALVGRWVFEKDACVNTVNPAFNATLKEGQLRVAPAVGVLGDALLFEGKEKPVLSITPDALPKGIRQLTFSAWVTPKRSTGTLSIFRKEDSGRHGDNRLAFTIRAGKFITLGINCGGNYAELDALAPPSLFNGEPHFIAGTFDGKFMRVYYDGSEIGSFERQVPLSTVHDYAPLRINRDAVANSNYSSFAQAANHGEPFFLGSSRIKKGKEEVSEDFFKGTLEDPRFYSRALSEAELLNLAKQNPHLHQPISVTQSSVSYPLERLLRSFDTQRVEELSKGADKTMSLYILHAALRADSPAAVNEYIMRWQTSPAELLFLTQPERRKLAETLIQGQGKNPAPAFEYLPLTDLQWSVLSKADRAKWERAKALKAKIETTKDDLAAADLLFLQSLVDERPARREHVAKYVVPTTPATKDLSALEARAALERDWLFQVDKKPTVAAAANEIQYARNLLARLNLPEARKADFTAKLNALADRVAKQDGTPKDLYLAVRTLKREIVFANPVIDFDSVVYTDSPAPGGSESHHETRHRLGYMAVPGGRLIVQKGLSPQGHLTQLAPSAPLHGTFWRPDLSFDASKVLFSFKPHNEKTFHLYEIGIDGTGLRQLTSGMFDDLDPIYLPDQKNILFTTTRGYIYVRCMPPTNAMVTARMPLDAKPGDKSLYITSRNGEPEYTPSVMGDGRILYTRWEYTDKPLWRAQKLWTMNNDTTNVQTYWGNQSVWPDLMKDARSIPGSNRVMFTGAGHHDWFAGSIGIIDPSKGLNFPHGLTKVTQDLAWPECGNGPTDPKENDTYHRSGRYNAYYSPYPLSEKEFLVSARRDGKFVLLFMDTDGNREIISEGVHNIWDALPVRKRNVPKFKPDAEVEWPTWETRDKPGTGLIYSNNVYENAPPELKNKAKYLRIWSIEHKTYTYWVKRNYVSSGPEVSATQSEGVKKIIGTVPIEADGSVAFRAPSGIALHFQLLDDQHRALQTMKSFTGVQPGETRACFGCHEQKMNAVASKTMGLAMRKPPASITPVPWNDITVGFERYVQPTLDQYCGKCHGQPGSPANKTFDSRLRPGFLGFKEPYMTLLGSPTWGQNYRPRNDLGGAFGWADTIMVESYSTVAPAAYATFPAMTRLSYASRLVKRISGEKVTPEDKHPLIKVDPENRLRVIHWIDAMGPYNGAEEIRNMEDPIFPGKDWISQPPRIHNAPIVQRPGPFDVFHPEEDPAYSPPQPSQYNALPTGVTRK